MKNNWNKYLSKQLITYMGNKRSLINEIEAQVKDIKSSLNKDKISFADIFAGSGVVSRMAKKHSTEIFTNDLEFYSYKVNEAFLKNLTQSRIKAVKKDFVELNRQIKEQPVRNGYIRKNYSPKSEKDIKDGERVFYTPKNAMIIDSAIKHIKSFDDTSSSIMMGMLLVEASIHVNTAGIFKGFYKNSITKKGQFGGNGRNALKRILSDIKLEFPVLTKTATKINVSQLEAQEFANNMEAVDVVYLDPPYNQHPYGSNYFMLNLIAKDVRPTKISRVSGIPEDWNRSQYNKAAFAADTLFDLCKTLNTKYIIISYNSDGFIKKPEFTERLSKIGVIEKAVEIKYNTFRGSRNLKARDLHVKEYLFIVRKNNDTKC